MSTSASRTKITSGTISPWRGTAYTALLGRYLASVRVFQDAINDPATPTELVDQLRDACAQLHTRTMQAARAEAAHAAEQVLVRAEKDRVAMAKQRGKRISSC